MSVRAAGPTEDQLVAQAVAQGAEEGPARESLSKLAAKGKGSKTNKLIACQVHRSRGLPCLTLG